jgi:hypothetical protein
MIHILTVHWQTEKWIKPQLRYIQKHTSIPYRVYAFLNGFDAHPHAGRFYYTATEDVALHAAKLNMLADIASTRSQSADDWLVFIDSDCFPIADWVAYVADGLEKYPLVAVRRDENLGDPQPHPCFCATTVGFWREIGGDWNAGFRWTNTIGKSVTDVGGNLLKLLNEKNAEWLPILRTNAVNLDPLFFAVYGRVIYHHGAGSRIPLSRVGLEELKNAFPAWLSPLLNKMGLHERYSRRRQKRVEALSESIYAEIVRNPEFWLRFAGSKEPGRPTDPGSPRANGESAAAPCP